MKRSLTVLVASALALALAAPLASAFVLTLGGPTGEDGTVNTDLASVLYATGPDGKIVTLAAIGDATPSGGPISDLGAPSIAPEGQVVFGAESLDANQHPRWDIFAADPADPEHRLTPVLHNAAAKPGCTPMLRIDPYAVAGPGGQVAFIAPSRHGDALFRYSEGELNCVARVGDRLARRAELSMFGFGSLRVSANGDMVFSARVRTHGAKSERAALILAHNGGGVEEIAREGETAPGGGKYRGPFDHAAVERGANGTMIAFTDRGQPTRLYLYNHGAVRLMLGVGTVTQLGKLNYLSLGQPAVASDGSVAVLGKAENTSAVFIVKGNSVRAVAWEGERTSNGTAANSFDVPLFGDSGTLYSAIVNDRDEMELCRISPAQPAYDPASAHQATLATTSIPVFGATLIGNERGNLAFLGHRQSSEIHDVSE